MSDPSFTCRTKHISGSPRHKGLKKTHFIKNMRQYDTKNSRYWLQPPAWAAPRGPPQTWWEDVLPWGHSSSTSPHKRNLLPNTLACPPINQAPGSMGPPPPPSPGSWGPQSGVEVLSEGTLATQQT